MPTDAPAAPSLPAPTTNGTGHSPQPPGSAPSAGSPPTDASAAPAAAAGTDSEQRKEVGKTLAEEDALLARAQAIRVHHDSLAPAGLCVAPVHVVAVCLTIRPRRQICCDAHLNVPSF